MNGLGRNQYDDAFASGQPACEQSLVGRESNRNGDISSQQDKHFSPGRSRFRGIDSHGLLSNPTSIERAPPRVPRGAALPSTAPALLLSGFRAESEPPRERRELLALKKRQFSGLCCRGRKELFLLLNDGAWLSVAGIYT
ncbi:hypothetical protein GN956_G23133 [Arapaima gigas]